MHINSPKNKILVLIPAFNEEHSISSVIAKVHLIVPQYDILVVDDGSTDRTARKAKEARAMVVSHPFNLGYGVAIQTGYKFAYQQGYNFLIQIDGDGQHDPACIPDLLLPVQQNIADFVIGSRFLGTKNYHPTFIRKTGMIIFRTIVSLITKIKITDSTSGFQAFNRDVIRYFVTDDFPCDYPDADVLINLHLSGFKIHETSVRMFASADGKTMHGGFKPIYYVFKMFLSILVTLLRKK